MVHTTLHYARLPRRVEADTMMLQQEGHRTTPLSAGLEVATTTDRPGPYSTPTEETRPEERRQTPDISRFIAGGTDAQHL